METAGVEGPAGSVGAVLGPASSAVAVLEAADSVVAVLGFGGGGLSRPASSAELFQLELFELQLFQLELFQLFQLGELLQFWLVWLSFLIHWSWSCWKLALSGQGITPFLLHFLCLGTFPPSLPWLLPYH